MKKRCLSAILVLVPVLAGCGSGPPYREKPSVILILIDALRADHVGCFGHSPETTPAIDSLCRDGVAFRTAITTSGWTQPAVASLFTGLNPLQHGVMRWPRKKKDQLQVTIFPERLVTLAERLQGAGYRTAGFIANPYLEGLIGFNQGFETYVVDDMDAGKLQEEFLRWLDNRGPGPFFAYLHYMEPHWPYSEGLADVDPSGPVPAEADYTQEDWEALHRRLEDEPESVGEAERRHLESLYDGSIRALDDHVGALLRELDARDLRDRVLFVVTADHGEEFGEHGRYGHIRTLFDSLLRVPLIFAFPDRWQAGLMVDQQVRTVDVLPTLLDAVGADPPEEILGRSLLPMIRDGGHDAGFPPYAFGEFMWSDTYLRQSVRTSEYKFIRTFNRGSGSEGLGHDVPPARLSSFLDTAGNSDLKVTRGLYDLVRDPGETRNLIRQQPAPAAAAKLEAVLDEWLRANAANFDAEEPDTLELRGEILERLEGLGYLQ